MRKKTVYTFRELSEKAHQVAASDVYCYMAPTEEWELKMDGIKEMVKVHLTEKTGDERIDLEWEVDQYHNVSIKKCDVDLPSELIEKNLSDQEYGEYEALNQLPGGDLYTERESDNEWSTTFEINQYKKEYGDFNNHLPKYQAFLKKCSEYVKEGFYDQWKEMRFQSRLAGNDFDEEMENFIIETLENVATFIAAKVDETYARVYNELIKEAERDAKKMIEYYDSEEFYLNELKEDAYEDLRFLLDGSLVNGKEKERYLCEDCRTYKRLDQMEYTERDKVLWFQCEECAGKAKRKIS